MQTIAVVMLRADRVSGRPVDAGETVEVSPVLALALTYQRKARFLRASDAAPAAAPKKKRAYKRRDLQAEE